MTTKPKFAFIKTPGKYENKPYDFDLDIVYYDDALIVANKPPSLLSVPGLASSDNLCDALDRTFGRIHVVHRLDCETSGLIVYARDPITMKHLHRQFAQRQVLKTYEALGYGNIALHSGIIDIPLKEDYKNRPKQTVNFQNGRSAITYWEALHSNHEYTRFRLKPITGRTHQLRLHLMWLGHPILGDKLYTKVIRPVESVLYPKMCLHATELSFFHPELEKMMTFKSQAPF